MSKYNHEEILGHFKWSPSLVPVCNRSIPVTRYVTQAGICMAPWFRCFQVFNIPDQVMFHVFVKIIIKFYVDDTFWLLDSQRICNISAEWRKQCLFCSVEKASKMWTDAKRGLRRQIRSSVSGWKQHEECSGKKHFVHTSWEKRGIRAVT